MAGVSGRRVHQNGRRVHCRYSRSKVYNNINQDQPDLVLCQVADTTHETPRFKWEISNYSMGHVASLSHCWQWYNQMLWNVRLMAQGEEGLLGGLSFCWSLCIWFLLIENDKYTPIPRDFIYFWVFFCFQCVQTLVPIQFPSSFQRVPQLFPIESHSYPIWFSQSWTFMYIDYKKGWRLDG
jgi:hypothetical protein